MMPAGAITRFPPSKSSCSGKPLRLPRRVCGAVRYFASLLAISIHNDSVVVRSLLLAPSSLDCFRRPARSKKEQVQFIETASAQGRLKRRSSVNPAIIVASNESKAVYAMRREGNAQTDNRASIRCRRNCGSTRSLAPSTRLGSAR